MRAGTPATFPRPQRPVNLGKVDVFYVSGQTTFAWTPDGTPYGWGPLHMDTLKGHKGNALVPVPLRWPDALRRDAPR